VPVLTPSPPPPLQLDLQRAMAASLPHSSLHVLSTPHGHDGFLIEIDALNKAASRWVQGVPQLK